MRFIEFIKPDVNVNFIGYRNFALALSGIAVLVSLVLILTMGFNYGIEFAGGIELRVKVNKDVHAKEIRQALSEKGFTRTAVQEYVDLKNVYSIKIKGNQLASESDQKTLSDQATELLDTLEAKFGKGNIENISTDMIGPRVGQTLRKKGLYAILSAIVGILIYIGFRFNFRFAPGAVIALVHDVTITAGIFVFLQHEITLAVIAAFLTIAGYSINDTIIVFDRIREGLRFTHAKKSDDEPAMRGLQNAVDRTVNTAINQTLSRTILTSATTLIVVVSLYVLGGEILRDFAFAMIIGVLVGTYSSIFIASPFFLLLERAKNKRGDKKGKGFGTRGKGSKRKKIR